MKFLGMIITSIWFLFLLSLLLNGAIFPCENVPASGGLLQRYFSCLQPNAIGDFLAGVFAPLAFVWLVIAVVLQGKELAAQRKELQISNETLRTQGRILNKQARIQDRQYRLSKVSAFESIQRSDLAISAANELIVVEFEGALRSWLERNFTLVEVHFPIAVKGPLVWHDSFIPSLNIHYFPENFRSSKLSWQQICERRRIPSDNATLHQIITALNSVFGWPENVRFVHSYNIDVTREFGSFLSEEYGTLEPVLGSEFGSARLVEGLYHDVHFIWGECTKRNADEAYSAFLGRNKKPEPIDLEKKVIVLDSQVNRPDYAEAGDWSVQDSSEIDLIFGPSRLGSARLRYVSSRKEAKEFGFAARIQELAYIRKRKK